MNGLYPIVRRVRRPLVVADAEPPEVVAGPARAVAVAPAVPPLVRVADAPESAVKAKGKAGGKVSSK
jgi:hypothetical protein